MEEEILLPEEVDKTGRNEKMRWENTAAKVASDRFLRSDCGECHPVFDAARHSISCTRNDQSLAT
jgi:hypothetical protein